MNYKDKRIAIIGAGPGGLTLARILQQGGLTPVIYEQETSHTERQQGGTLDLDEQTGQKGLQAADRQADTSLAANRPIKGSGSKTKTFIHKQPLPFVLSDEKSCRENLGQINGKS
ncbi:hypothetical protein AXI58_15400 [Bacillus nakamurai]|uniref:FAD-binding domain-containing protein n=1 Tax=Bacillus nakamurai TaxID=1793963 RepID=A0A150F796_9BACI|nr:hypothetical protein AXI58_15400 [Bacillus nakamurai]